MVVVVTEKEIGEDKHTGIQQSSKSIIERDAELYFSTNGRSN